MNTVAVTEWLALHEALSGMQGSALWIAAGLYMLQVAAGVYAGHRYDQKATAAEAPSGIKSVEFAIGFFEKLKALSQRDKGRISLYVFSVLNYDELQQTVTEERLAEVMSLIEESILGTVRKSDVVMKWEVQQYVVIAADRGHAESVLPQRLMQQAEAAAGHLPMKICFGASGATYPLEGQEFDYLLALAQERVYQLRDARQA